MTFVKYLKRVGATYDAVKELAEAYPFTPEKARGALEPCSGYDDDAQRPRVRIVFCERPRVSDMDPNEASGAYSDVELVMPEAVYAQLRSIGLDIGGLHFDTLWLGDAACSFLNDAYDRPVIHADGKVVVPLLLSGLTPNCVSCSVAYHDHALTFDPPVEDLSDVEIRAFVNTPPQEFLTGPRQMMIQQTQYHKHPVGKRRACGRLPFTCPVHAVYFHFGSAHASVCLDLTRVMLRAKGILTVTLEGPFDPEPGYITIPVSTGAVVPATPPKRVVDFRTCDALSFEFEWSKAPGPADLHMFCHTYNLMRSMHGMAGLVMGC